MQENNFKESISYDDIIENQRKEKKDLLAKTQKMKHGVSKSDKKRKKEVTADIAHMMEDMEIKHKKELEDFQSNGLNNSSRSQNESELPVPTNTTEGFNDNNLLVAAPDKTDIPESTSQKLSKAQRRRNKKAQNERDRESAIAEQEIDNLTGLRHQEFLEIKNKLSSRHLRIHEIPSDGNCLYKAIEHQLSSLKLQEASVNELRKNTSNYLLLHKEDFINFLINPNTGDILTDEQFSKYCEDIAQTPAWGGHVEIQVLAILVKRPIEVIQAFGSSVIAGDENVSPKLVISYHRHAFGLGAHYNSIIPDTTEEKDE